MGLACAGQIASLGCYPVERDYAANRDPTDVEHNYRYIDDIQTLTGCIPTEKQYGMQYKDTRPKEGELVYLGMEQKWLDAKDGVKYITGMHFRDATYPIKIRRYPGSGSMVTDSQRMGVITGQFIRAQRLCNTLRTFKEAVQNVALAAMRRGYKRRELDRMWGKFLVNWWKAEEMRRGELRSWFRKMTSRVHKTMQRENRGQEQDHQLGQRECKHGSRCLYKTSACPFAHPAIRVPSAPKGDQEMVPSEPAEGVPSAPEGTKSRAPSAPSEDVEMVPSESLQKEEGVPPAPGPRQQEEVRVPPVPGAWQQRG
jgi:hypothetical protein